MSQSSGDTFKQESSLRSKILYPFLAATLVMASASIFISFQLISESMEEQLVKSSTQESKLISTELSSYFDTAGYYSERLNGIIRAKKVDRLEIPSFLSDKDQIELFWSVEDLGTDLADDLAPLIESGKKGQRLVETVLRKDALGDVSVGIVTITPRRTANGNDPVVTWSPLSYETVGKSSLGLVDRDFAFFYHETAASGGDVHVFAASPKIRQASDITDRLSRLIQPALTASENVTIFPISLEDTQYKVLVERQAFNPQFYTTLLVPLASIRESVDQMVWGSVLVLLVMAMLIFLIYAVVVRKITTSIDILTAVAKKVSKGDLTQQVFVSTKDEIGSLSTIFNRMVKNLQDSSASLLKEKKQSEAIITSIPDGILVTDLKDRLILANQPAEQFLSFSMEKSVGQPVAKCFDLPELNKVLKDVKRSKTPLITSEINIVGDDDKTRFYALTSTVVQDEQGQKIGFVTTLKDITHDKELDHLRDSFLRTVSHELRTPLTSIMGFIELVKDESLSEEKAQYLRIALEESMSLKELINDLLDLSRIEAGKMEMTVTKINCYELVNSVVATLEPLTKSKNLTLKSTLRAKTLSVHADLPKLRRVFVNLISNAIKFTETGEIVIGCKKEKDQLTFSVSDTGIGLMPDEQKLIFEKFRQVDYSSTRRYEGIGLGLSIVRELVELHRGKIWVESTYGEGSTFYFTLPLTGPDVS